MSDPDVQNAWKEVRSDTSSTNWLVSTRDEGGRERERQNEKQRRGLRT